MNQPNDSSGAPSQAMAGTLYALSAFILWGLYPIYFKWLGGIPPLQIVSHRVIWIVVLLGGFLLLAGRWNTVRRVFADKRLLSTVVLTAMFISGNWLVYIWAVLNDRVLEGSLGYFINPLVNVFLGVVFLRERLRPLAWIAVGLTAVGIAFPVVSLGELPWVSLFLGFSFGFYGLIRKLAPVDAFAGLFCETLVVLPLALGFLAWVTWTGESLFLTQGLGTDLALVSTGLATAAPLVLFALAAKRMAYTTIGFFQYLAPSMHFVFGVWLYHEPLGWQRGVTFVCIWVALALYSVDGLRARRRKG